MNKFIRISDVYIAANQIVSICLKKIPSAKHDELMGAIKVLTTAGVEYMEKFYRDFSVSWYMDERNMEDRYEEVLQDIVRRLQD